MTYQNRFVIFMDILGFKEKMNSTVDKKGNSITSKIDEVITAMNLVPELYHVENKELRSFSKTKMVTQFSDSIVVSFEIEALDEIFLAIDSTNLLVLELVYKGFLCRGGIAFGKLLHTTKHLFGPALVEAYELENKAAIYPRVIVDEMSLFNALKAFVESKGSFSNSDRIDFEEIQKLFSKDFDGHYYLDYIINVFNRLDKGVYKKYYPYLKKTIQNGLAHPSQSTKTKYYWMREKYNQFVSNATSNETIQQIMQSGDKKLLAFCKSLKLI